jgi:hypothetical protein
LGARTSKAGDALRSVGASPLKLFGSYGIKPHSNSFVTIGADTRLKNSLRMLGF